MKMSLHLCSFISFIRLLERLRSSSCWTSRRLETISNTVPSSRTFARLDRRSYGSLCWYLLKHVHTLLRSVTIWHKYNHHSYGRYNTQRILDDHWPIHSNTTGLYNNNNNDDDDGDKSCIVRQQPRKPCYCRWLRDVPNTCGFPENLRESLAICPRLLFTKLLMGFLLWSIVFTGMCVQKFELKWLEICIVLCMKRRT